MEALQRTGRNLTRESLLKAIESIKDWDPGWGLKYSYGGDNRRVMSRAGASRHGEGRQVGEDERVDDCKRAGWRSLARRGVIAEILASQVVSGLATGCVYALIALGFVLIYKATDVVNFAQGEFVMVSGFISYTLLIWYGLPYWLVFSSPSRCPVSWGWCWSGWSCAPSWTRPSSASSSPPSAPRR